VQRNPLLCKKRLIEVDSTLLVRLYLILVFV
jgi:hypothetical protein